MNSKNNIRKWTASSKSFEVISKALDQKRNNIVRKMVQMKLEWIYMTTSPPPLPYKFSFFSCPGELNLVIYYVCEHDEL